jgi:hypothetical protein
MKPSDIKAGDIREYARRDWAFAEHAKEAHWVEQRAEMSLEEALGLADGLRQFARLVRPDWPTAADREEDFAGHERLVELFRVASPRAAGQSDRCRDAGVE